MQLDPQGASRIQAMIDYLETYGATLQEIKKAKYQAEAHGVVIEKIILPRPRVMDIAIEFGDVPEPTFKFSKNGASYG